MRTSKHKTLATLLPAAAVAASVMAAGIAGHAAGRYVNSAPHVGHIIAFESGTIPSSDARLSVRRQDGSSCALELDILHRLGGSLVVEGQTESAAFVTHWAGRHTTGDTQDCGGDATLMVRRAELDRLAASAGGYDQQDVIALGR